MRLPIQQADSNPTGRLLAAGRGIACSVDGGDTWAPLPLRTVTPTRTHSSIRTLGARSRSRPSVEFKVMRIITGKVVDGRIDLPPDALEEGTSVAVLAGDSEEPVALSAAEELQLSQAVDAVARGEFVDGDDLIKELRSRRRA